RRGACAHERPPGSGVHVPPKDAAGGAGSVGGVFGSGCAGLWARRDRPRPRNDRGPAAAPRALGALLGRVGRARPTLLELDAPAGLLELGLELLGLVAVEDLLDGLGSLVDERLGLLQAQAGRRADDLDDLDLLVAGRGEHDVDGARLLLGRGVAAATAGGRCGRCDGRRGDAELLLERLDALGEL